MNVKKLLSTRRFIPAYAGNSFGQRSLAITLYGSSPLTRGTHPSLNVNKSPARFIPAYAGNSILDIVYLPNHSVHPRLRGELGSKERQSPRPGGSSPLTRGTQSQLDENGRIRRFIPAYAGNSVFGVLLSRGQPVHPRLRGELFPISGRSRTSTGSSPLTRGTQFLTGDFKILSRFIPAYAGNSEAVSRKYSEKFGSSPLTRGTLA